MSYSDRERRIRSTHHANPLCSSTSHLYSGFPQRCPVTELRKLTPDEVKALPPKARPD